eukprot:Tbor_TRINITY_DN5140_c3_g1::TRINITY_DN5140_c3_g1_i3::g.25954::m.25954
MPNFKQVTPQDIQRWMNIFTSRKEINPCFKDSQLAHDRLIKQDGINIITRIFHLFNNNSSDSLPASDYPLIIKSLGLLTKDSNSKFSKMKYDDIKWENGDFFTINDIINEVLPEIIKADDKKEREVRARAAFQRFGNIKKEKEKNLENTEGSASDFINIINNDNLNNNNNENENNNNNNCENNYKKSYDLALLTAAFEQCGARVTPAEIIEILQFVNISDENNNNNNNNNIEKEEENNNNNNNNVENTADENINNNNNNNENGQDENNNNNNNNN